MKLSRAEVERLLARTGNAAPVKKRKRNGTGDLAKRKQWMAEMSRLPGHFMPIVTKSEANMRDRWGIIKRAQQNNLAAFLYVCLLKQRRTLTRDWPIIVTMTRYGKRVLDDDNLQRSLKAVRDGIADAIGIDDGDTEFYTWQYKQEKGMDYGVRLEFEQNGRKVY
jgi:hypothetical protein